MSAVSLPNRIPANTRILVMGPDLIRELQERAQVVIYGSPLGGSMVGMELRESKYVPADMIILVARNEYGQEEITGVVKVERGDGSA